MKNVKNKQGKKAHNPQDHENHNKAQQTNENHYWKDHNSSMPDKLSAGSINIARSYNTRSAWGNKNLKGEENKVGHHKPGTLGNKSAKGK